MTYKSIADYEAQCSASKQLLAEFLDKVWSQGDVDACDRYIAANYNVWHDPGDRWHGQLLSREMFKERVRESRRPFPDQQFIVQRMVAEPDLVSVSWLWEGTFLEDFAGFKATGQKISMSGLTLYDFADQKISGHWQLCDRLGVFQQLQTTGR